MPPAATILYCMVAANGRFGRNYPFLFSILYRVPGSVADAENILLKTYLRREDKSFRSRLPDMSRMGRRPAS